MRTGTFKNLGIYPFTDPSNPEVPVTFQPGVETKAPRTKWVDMQVDNKVLEVVEDDEKAAAEKAAAKKAAAEKEADENAAAEKAAAEKAAAEKAAAEKEAAEKAAAEKAAAKPKK